jgi:hypothetical protein
MVRSMIDFGYNDQDIAFVMNINVQDVQQLVGSVSSASPGATIQTKISGVGRMSRIKSAIPVGSFRTPIHTPIHSANQAKNQSTKNKKMTIGGHPIYQVAPVTQGV